MCIDNLCETAFRKFLREKHPDVVNEEIIELLKEGFEEGYYESFILGMLEMTAELLEGDTLTELEAAKLLNSRLEEFKESIVANKSK